MGNRSHYASCTASFTGHESLCGCHAQDQARIAALEAENATLTQERDKAKSTAEAMNEDAKKWHERYMGITTNWNAARLEHEQTKAALTELVRLKRLSSRHGECDVEYRRCKPAAWAAAFALIPDTHQ